MEFKFIIGDSTSALTKVTNVLNSFKGVLMWIFFIVVACIIARYIKRKNATGKKHS